MTGQCNTDTVIFQNGPDSLHHSCPDNFSQCYDESTPIPAAQGDPHIIITQVVGTTPLPPSAARDGAVCLCDTQHRVYWHSQKSALFLSDASLF